MANWIWIIHIIRQLNVQTQEPHRQGELTNGYLHEWLRKNRQPLSQPTITLLPDTPQNKKVTRTSPTRTIPTGFQSPQGTLAESLVRWDSGVITPAAQEKELSARITGKYFVLRIRTIECQGQWLEQHHDQAYGKDLTGIPGKDWNSLEGKLHDEGRANEGATGSLLPKEIDLINHHVLPSQFISYCPQVYEAIRF